MNKSRTLYRISTGLFSVLIVFGAGMYFLDHAMVAEKFTALGYPTYIIYPLATAKLLGLVAIWTRRSLWLKEWAYAGFAYDLILAASAHANVGDGEWAPALVGLALLLTSYAAQKSFEGSP